jgi:hypothetical protein
MLHGTEGVVLFSRAYTDCPVASLIMRTEIEQTIILKKPRGHASYWDQNIRRFATTPLHQCKMF